MSPEKVILVMADTSEHSELKYRLRQQALLTEFGRRALAENDVGLLLNDAVRLSAMGLNTRYCKVLEYEPETNRMRLVAGLGWEPELIGTATVGADLDSPAGYALHMGKPVITNDLPHDRRFRTPELLRTHGISRAVNVILMRNGAPFGVLEADSDETGRSFSETDVDFIQSIAHLLGSAIDRIAATEAMMLLNQTLEERVREEVSERRKTESILHEAQKLEAIGRLTGGVAHDFNNLLMVINGGLNMLAKEVADRPNAVELIARIRKGAARGQQLTSQLLAFARQQPLHREPRDLNELVREFDMLASRILGEAITLKIDLSSDIGACELDAAEFGAALLNLIVNARDAIADSGEVAIRTRKRTLTGDEAKALCGESPSPCDYAVLEVEDTGSGMSEEVRKRVLEPFFTTKEAGKGTGLGLSQVCGFVQQSGGFLTIDSTPGMGTLVRLYFPRQNTSASQHVETKMAPTPHGRGETVLVVEDDDDVRDIAVAFLEDLGYSTLVAHNAPEGLSVLQNAHADLVLTDMVMPGGMSGIELAERLATRSPPVPVILTSGYARSGSVAGAQRHGVPILWKPYQQDDLARTVRETLDRR